YGWSSADMDDDGEHGGDGYISSYTNVTTTAEGSVIGEGFTSSNLPAVGYNLAAGKSLTVPINFNSDEVGNYQSVFNIWTNGGTKYVLLTSSATTSPIAKLATETSEGGWDTSGIMDFGMVKAGTTVTRRLRICNEGGSPLQITKSKPPIQAELRAENPTSDLHEGQSISAGECAYAPIDIAAAPTTPNIPSHDVSDVWVWNTDDLTFGVHEVEIKGTIISRQVGPTYANGTAKYTYLGCYLDVAPRELEKLYDLNTLNENGICNVGVAIFLQTEQNTLQKAPKSTIDVIDLSIGYHNVKNADIDINVKLRVADLDNIKPVDVTDFNFDIDVFECHIFDLTIINLPNLDLPNFHLPNFRLPNFHLPDLEFSDLKVQQRKQSDKHILKK
ncbi:MAG: hypothetical protein Q9204_008289, partial [Flavoplaca sp. TL-2023a]